MAVLRDTFGELDFLSSVLESVNSGLGPVDTLFSLFQTGGKGKIPPLTGHLNIGYSVNGLKGFIIRVLGTEGSLEVGWNHIDLYKNHCAGEAP